MLAEAKDIVDFGARWMSANLGKSAAEPDSR
jgi:hypothetical protein